MDDLGVQISLSLNLRSLCIEPLKGSEATVAWSGVPRGLSSFSQLLEKKP